MTPNDSIEATASTVDQAISQALDQLGAHQDDVTIEVLSTPRSGVLGLGARPARVRVTRRAPEIARSTVQSPPPAPPLKRTPPESRPSAPPVSPPRSQPANPTGSRTEARFDVRPEPSPSAPRDLQPPPLRRPADESYQEDLDDDRQPAIVNETGTPERRSRADDSSSAPRQETRSDDRPRRGRDSRSDNRRDNRSAPRPNRGQNRDDRRTDSPRTAQPDDSQGASPDIQQESPQGNGSGRAEGRRDDSPRPRRDRDRPPRAAGGESRADTPPRPRAERPRRDDSAASSASDHDPGLDSFSDDGSGSDQRNLVAPEEQIVEATNILTEVLKMMGEQAEIEVVRDEGLQTVELNIKGDGSGILIGRHGQTLDALEYIVNRILGRRIKDAVAIAIDTESYRARRRGQLHRMALSKGEQAKREHVTVTLDPMAPRDRRIVHLALKDDPLITTRSFGDGFLRSIEVVPVNGSHDRDRGERDRRERRDRSREPDRDRDRDNERDNDDLPLGQQGGFKHGQKRIV
jgi:spoIIIJ-associated protein